MRLTDDSLWVRAQRIIESPQTPNSYWSHEWLAEFAQGVLALLEMKAWTEENQRLDGAKALGEAIRLTNAED